MKLFIDESGSITTSRTLPNRYFVIGFLETEYPYNMIRQFKAAKKDYITRTPDSRLDIKAEIKGSEMPFGMKKLIFERITEKTDAVFHYIIIDNFNLYESIATHSALSFNYFVYWTVAQIKNNKRKSNEKLYLDIDDRNTALRSLNSLEDYLKIKFIIEKSVFEDVRVKYHESDKKDLIQVVDLFCNTVYRLARFSDKDRKNRQLLSLCRVGSSDYYPAKYCELDFCCSK